MIYKLNNAIIKIRKEGDTKLYNFTVSKLLVRKNNYLINQN